MNYFEEKTKGIIAFIKKNNGYSYYDLDSGFCVLKDYKEEIANGSYFRLIENSRLDLDQMRNSFHEAKNSANEGAYPGMMTWYRPNIFIDFDKRILLNHYFDRAFENDVPNNWRSQYINSNDKFLQCIPQEYIYW